MLAVLNIPKIQKEETKRPSVSTKFPTRETKSFMKTWRCYITVQRFAEQQQTLVLIIQWIFSQAYEKCSYKFSRLMLHCLDGMVCSNLFFSLVCRNLRHSQMRTFGNISRSSWYHGTFGLFFRNINFCNGRNGIVVSF